MDKESARRLRQRLWDMDAIIARLRIFVPEHCKGDLDRLCIAAGKEADSYSNIVVAGENNSDLRELEKDIERTNKAVNDVIEMAIGEANEIDPRDR